MFRRLQQKWKVSSKQFILILCVFAITGTLTAYISKAITSWVGFNEQTSWTLKLSLRLLILVFGYQAILLFVALLFGQFSFFWKYERKILERMRILKKNHGEGLVSSSHRMPDPPKITHLAIFASGAGSNARRIIEHFRHSSFVKVSLVVCNKPGAGVINIAEQEGIPALLIEKERFFRGDAYLPELSGRADLIILAGFLWKIPMALIAAYPRRIINIHPALLPKFGGKGMYGSFVHKAVIEAKEPSSGITIHYVDEHYDHGDVIFQKECPVLPTDTPESLAEKIHALEHRYFPEVIDRVIQAD
jgi:formyltetrahydrofolate-dependent phosphoribosylglycinamide formyltransferase